MALLLLLPLARAWQAQCWQAAAHLLPPGLLQLSLPALRCLARLQPLHRLLLLHSQRAWACHLRPPWLAREAVAGPPPPPPASGCAACCGSARHVLGPPGWLLEHCQMLCRRAGALQERLLEVRAGSGRRPQRPSAAPSSMSDGLSMSTEATRAASSPRRPAACCAAFCRQSKGYIRAGPSSKGHHSRSLAATLAALGSFAARQPPQTPLLDQLLRRRPSAAPTTSSRWAGAPFS